MQQVVIVGAGHAGVQCAASLRQEGFDGSIVLVGDEDALPYQRPPLSKAYLLGQASVHDLQLRPARFYEEQRIERVQARVEAIDRGAQRLALQDGRALPYDHLVLATGSRPRTLPFQAAGLQGVFNLQTLADADRLRALLPGSRRAVVVGAGFIGLEFACVARSLGLEVTVVDVADRALSRALSAPCAGVLVESHARLGVRFMFGCGVEGLESDQGRISSLHTRDGSALPADLVIVGIGAEPRAQLGAQAGLAMDKGIVVDARLLTSDAAISAIGDVASFPLQARRIRLESVQNASDQARTVAARLVGKEVAYAPVPWFWSDQGELKLQIAGLQSGGEDHVLLRDAAGPATTVLCLQDGRLVAVETVNRPADHMLARRLIAQGVRVTPERARAPGFSLSLLNAPGSA